MNTFNVVFRPDGELTWPCTVYDGLKSEVRVGICNFLYLHRTYYFNSALLSEKISNKKINFGYREQSG